MEIYKIWLSFYTYDLLVVYIDEDLRVREKNIFTNTAQKWVKTILFLSQYVLPYVFTQFLLYIFVKLFFFGTLKSAATYRSLHLIRLARKNFKKTSLAKSVEHSRRRTIFCFFQIHRYTIFFPPDGIHHRMWANSSWLSAGETGDRLTKSFF